MKRLNFENLSLGIIALAIVLLISGITFYIQQDKNREAINKQTTSTNQLINDVKRLGEENKQLNQENKDYAYCTAQLIARYTRDKTGITIDDLRTCALSSFSSGSEPRGVTGSTQGTALQEIQLQSGDVVEIPRPISPTQSSGSSTTNNSTTNNTPTSPTNNTTTQPKSNSSPVLTVPNLLNVQTPCVNALNLVKTC